MPAQQKSQGENPGLLFVLFVPANLLNLNWHFLSSLGLRSKITKLLTNNVHGLRSFNSDADRVWSDPDNRDGDLVANKDSFTRLS